MSTTRTTGTCLAETAENRSNSSKKRQTCLLIGTPHSLHQLERQLAILGTDGPELAGAVVLRSDALLPVSGVGLLSSAVAVLGEVAELDSIVSRVRPDLALISLPSVLTEAIRSIRTQLRKLGIADRFIATLADQLNGVGPRAVFEVEVSELIDRPAVAIDEAAIAKTICGKRVLITGAGGSIGSELARIVARYEPRALFMMERSENALFEIDRQIARQHPRLTRGVWLHDVTDAEKTLNYCCAAKPEVIFHAAAHKHVPMMEDHPALAVENNFFGTKSIADAAAQTGCARFIMISTDKAVNPSSIMGATKRLAELYVQHLNETQTTVFEIVRFGNVLGSTGSVLPTWLQQIREGGPLTVTASEMTRFFMTIPEAAALVLQAAALPTVEGGDVAVLDMGEPISILGLAQRLIERHGLGWVLPTASGDGLGNEVASGDEFSAGVGGSALIPIIFTGIRPGEKLHEELAYAAEEMKPSPHPGIRIWQSRAPGETLVGDMVATLAEACTRGDAETVVTALLRLVPEMRVATGLRARPEFTAAGSTVVETTGGAGRSLYRTDTTARLEPWKVA